MTTKAAPGRQQAASGRRGFLKLAGLGAAAGTVGAAVGVEPATAAEAVAETTSSGYRETAHVRQVYALARF